MGGKPRHLEKFGQLCILGVDDDQVNLMVMDTLLKPQGWKIVTAMDSTEAYEALDEDTWPDIVFLDYNLEVGDPGIMVLKKLRETFGACDIPIVMCTAMSADASELQECLRLGAADILLKPYDRNKMVDLVQRLLGSKMKAATAAAAAAAAPAPAAPAPAPVAAPCPAVAPPAPAAAPASASEPEIVAFCKKLDLEYVGMKLSDAGITMDALKGMDDTGLRKAGVVVKGQRDKILAALSS